MPAAAAAKLGLAITETWKMLLAGAVFAALLGGPLKIEDDPYKSYAVASVSTEIRAETGLGHYCQTGGYYVIEAIRDRKQNAVQFGLTVRVNGLRSPGRILAVDLLGGLDLHQTGDTAGNVACSGSGCWNDAMATFVIPDTTLAALAQGADIPLRITTSMGDRCRAEGALGAASVQALRGWAEGKPEGVSLSRP